MLRSLFAIIGGYISMSVGIILTTAVVARVLPAIIENGQPSPNYIAANLAYSAFFAVVGGYVAGLIAGREPLKHAIILAVVCALFFLLYIGAPTPKDQPPTPIWYKIGLLVISVPSITLGGFLRQRHTRALS